LLEVEGLNKMMSGRPPAIEEHQSQAYHKSTQTLTTNQV